LATVYAELGKSIPGEIKQLPYTEWLSLFHLCYEWRWADHLVGNYCFIGWPSPGGPVEQFEIILQIFEIIKGVKRERFFDNLKRSMKKNVRYS
jgi:hypothetical protein